MSYRGKVACGWCLTPEQFERLSTDEGSGDDKYNNLDSRLIDIKELIIEKSEWKTINDRDSTGGSLIDADILNGGFPDHSHGWEMDHWAELRLKEHQRLRNASDLMTSISTPDDTLLYMFFPNAWFKSKYYRYDDYLDSMICSFPFEMDGRNDDPMYDSIKQLPYNPYPYANDIMNLDGSKKEWDSFWILDKEKDSWNPAPPKYLLWWLEKCNVLKPDGWKELRPYLCRWYS